MKRTYKLIVEYDGTEFLGYQTQIGDSRTVQSVLEEALHTLTIRPDVIYGAGRTDTGVHALGQVISFEAECPVPTERLAIALNGKLPPDVSVVSAAEMPAGFNARFSATQRTYIYVVWTRRTRSALWGRYSLHCRRSLSIARMREAAALLVGMQDFAAYAKTGGSPGPSTVRDLRRVAIRRVSDDRIVFVVTANGFLRSMVRNLVGALLMVGLGDLPPSAPNTILATRDRTANPCAPAAPHGLCLLRVDY